MSQLYRLFCEGLTVDQHSSTVIMTSTPLEEEDDGDAGPASPNFTPVSVRPPLPPLACRGDQAQQAETVSSSVQGQVGSASTESPDLFLGCGGDQSLAAADVFEAAAVAAAEAAEAATAVAAAALSTKPKPVDDSCRSSQHLKERNLNVSPVDFVDHLIAIRRRDEALGRVKRPKARPSEPTDESQSQNGEVARKSPRTCTEVSESSETDYEGASEYFRTLPTQNASVRAKSDLINSLSKSSNASSLIQKKCPPKKSSLSSRKSTDESNMNLVMECVSETSSESSLHESVRFEEDGLSAARCRIYSKPKEKSSESCKLTQENNLEQIMAAKVVLTDIQTSQEHCQLLKDPNSNNKLSEVLKGVTAYVEVRSGHDNRSMGVRTQLRALGAKVLEKFSKEVTHVVFNEGSPSTLRRAQSQGCHLVSVLWIDESKKSGQIAPEADHPPLNLHLYNVSSKYRKMKSLQPDFEEGKGEERLNKYVKRLRARSQKTGSSQPIIDKESDTSEGETTDPKEIPLKNLRVVLRRIDAVDSSGSSAKRSKRRLMPLQQESPASLTLEEFHPAERLRTEFPYSCQQKPRRIVKKKSSASQSFRRRSSCFVRGTQGFAGSQQKKVKCQMRTMVCTFMHRREIDVVAAVIKQLGGWILEPLVSQRTTHVVCGENKRTINLLRGIARGCWILHKEWVMRSLEAGYWLDEEPFELTVFPAITQSRVARETLGVCPDIFSTAGAIFVAKDTTPPQSDILHLLELCGALIAKSARQAKVVIGQYQRRASHTDVEHVKEQWVLDSIQENMLQPFRHYRLQCHLEPL